ncbi:hypothetical protein Hte_007061 [Hypoxylon texense]
MDDDHREEHMEEDKEGSEDVVEYEGGHESDTDVDDSSSEIDDTIEPIIINIHGLSEEPIRAFTVDGTEALTGMIKFSWSSEMIIGDMATSDGVKRIAMQLLENALEALNSASKTFFGTPHRATSSCHWDTLISRIVLAYRHGHTSSSFSSIVKQLANVHEELSRSFGTRFGQQSINTVNFFQERSDDYEIPVDKFNATLDRDRESMRKDYQDIVSLLARKGFQAASLEGSNPAYKNLCNWILSSEELTIWMSEPLPRANKYVQKSEAGKSRGPDSTPHTESTTQIPAETRNNSLELEMNSIRVLELGGLVQHSTVLADSLIASLKDSRRQPTDVFLDLAHNLPRYLPLTRTQLLSSLCQQLLAWSPTLFCQHKLLFSEGQDALSGFNSKWSEAVLWRYLKAILMKIAAGQTFLLIHEPVEPDFCAPFKQLISDIIDFVDANDVRLKVLYLRTTVAPNSPENSVTKEILGIRDLAVRIDIDLADSGIRSALEADYGECLIRVNRDRLTPIALKDIEDIVFANLKDLEIPLHCFALMERHPFLSLQSVKHFLLAGINQNVVATVLDSVPRAAKQLVEKGIMWITRSPRPPTCIKFAAALAIEFDSQYEAEINKDIALEFEKLLGGLVQINGGHIYVASCLGSALGPNHDIALKCYRHILKRYYQARFELKQDVKLGEKRSKHESRFEDSASQSAQVVAQEVIEEADIVFPDAPDTPPEVPDPLLSYAIEYLFTYLQAKGDGSVNENMFEVEFTANEDLINFCLKGQSRELVLLPTTTSLPSISRIQTLLKISVSEAAHLALCASELQGQHEYSGWFAITLAACQTDNVGAVKQLVKAGKITDDEIGKLFETGCDISLCALAKSRHGLVAKSMDRILQDAARLGNFDLIEYLMSEPELQQEFDNLQNRKPTVFTIARLGLLPSSQRFWDAQHRYVHYGENHKDRSTVLHQAVLSGNPSMVSKILSLLLMSSPPEKAVNQRDSTGATPLLHASSLGNISIVKQLLAAGADHSILDGKKQSPLCIASRNGYLEVVKALLQHGASISQKDDADKTAFHLAVEGNHSTVAAILVAKLTKEDISNYSTAIEQAVHRNNINILKSLLSLHNGVALSEEILRNCISSASHYGYEDILRELLSFDCPSFKYSPFMHAAWHGHVNCIEILLKKGYDCNSADYYGTTPIEVACEQGHEAAVRLLTRHSTRENLDLAYLRAAGWNRPNIVESLLDGGSININAKNSGKNTALHYAAYGSYVRLLEILAMHRADLEVKNSSGLAPLHDAARMNNPACVRILVRAGADVDVKDDRGRTPLYMATREGFREVVQILLDARCDLKVPPSDLHQFPTFLRLALETSTLEVFELIVKRLAAIGKLQIPPEVMHEFLQNEPSGPGKIKVLLQNGFDANQNIGEYGSMLHYAALWGRKDLVEVLCTFEEVNVNAVNESHGTPLQQAVVRGNKNSLAILNLLLTKNANIHKGSGRYGSPLCTVAAMPLLRDLSLEHGAAEAIKIYLALAREIIEYDPTTINDQAGYYRTPVQFAVNGGSIEMLEFLLAKKPKQDFLAGRFGTSLHLAAYYGRLDMAAILMESDEFLNRGRYDVAGRLPIHLAALSDRPGGDSLVRFFSNEGSGVTLLSTDKYQSISVVHFSAGQGRLPVVEMVVASHPNAVHDRDVDGWTPLHWACRNDNFDVVRFLLEHGADKNATTARGWTPFDVAMHSEARLPSDSECEELLRPDRQADTSNSSAKPALDPEDVTPARIEEAIRTDAGAFGCDVCDCIIFGVTYKCLDCMDFDLCFKCFRRVKDIHYSGHGFERVTATGEREDIDMDASLAA